MSLPGAPNPVNTAVVAAAGRPKAEPASTAKRKESKEEKRKEKKEQKMRK